MTLMGGSGRQPKPKLGVWRRGRWDWAYRFETLHGGYVYGCGFSTREQAREVMRKAKERLGLS